MSTTVNTLPVAKAATAAPQVAARRIEHFVFGHVLSQTGSRPGSA